MGNVGCEAADRSCGSDFAEEELVWPVCQAVSHAIPTIRTTAIVPSPTSVMAAAI